MRVAKTVGASVRHLRRIEEDLVYPVTFLTAEPRDAKAPAGGGVASRWQRPPQGSRARREHRSRFFEEERRDAARPGAYRDDPGTRLVPGAHRADVEPGGEEPRPVRVQVDDPVRDPPEQVGTAAVLRGRVAGGELEGHAAAPEEEEAEAAGRKRLIEGE